MSDNESVNEMELLLLHQLKEGDEAAYKILFTKYYESIVGFCKHFLFDLDSSQGIAQEAFLKLWLNRDKINKFNGIQSFLYTAAKSGCLNHIRHQKVEKKYQDSFLQSYEENLNCEILESFSFDNVEYKELDELIRESILELPDRCREVFEKKRFEEKKTKEIAQELNISEKAVEANMTRALSLLRKKLSNYLPVFLIDIAIIVFYLKK
ncbi:MAG: RNA polymerase sigma-70 factor [Carboxylicivirga sp.]|jgi:RNA polymerase sigma-70 factor (ECF subfamily)|nr:RNA polymerase sigma-70 factor [Carboxylicivirga sp.]